MENTPSLQLPAFDVPDLPSKPMTHQDYRLWIAENRRRLLECGRLAPILADPNRIPVDARFSFGSRE